MQTNLVRIELIKILKYKSFKVLLGLHLTLYFISVLMLSQVEVQVPGFKIGNLFLFPHAWHTFVWVAGWFNLILVILVIMVTCNEFAFKTFRQQFINGLKRDHLLAGKGLVILILAVYAFLMVMLTGTFFGIVSGSGPSLSGFFENFHMLFVYFLQTVAYMSLGFLIAILMRGTALSITMFFLLRLLIEPVIRGFFEPAARQFFPVKTISDLTPFPEVFSITSESEVMKEGADALTFEAMGLVSHQLPLYINVLLAAAYTALFILIARFYLQKAGL